MTRKKRENRTEIGMHGYCRNRETSAETGMNSTDSPAFWHFPTHSGLTGGDKQLEILYNPIREKRERGISHDTEKADHSSFQ